MTEFRLQYYVACSSLGFGNFIKINNVLLELILGTALKKLLFKNIKYFCRT